MDGSVYWIWLQRVLGFANRNTEQIIARFKNAKGVYDAPAAVLRECGLFSKAMLERISAKETMEYAADTVRKCAEKGISTITPEDSRYPRRFFDMCDYPTVIYCMGTLPDIDDNVVIGIVGTRSATKRGKQIITMLSRSLAQCGVIIVSGGAVGIDNAAHVGTFSTDSVTVSVLGCGLDVRYNLTCEPTRERILMEGGALISEFPPGYGADKYTFPVRNRLIAALSLGVIVGEAGEPSGAAITASRAVELGRDIFAVPGDVLNPLSTTPNSLIRDGAKPVTSAIDVVEEYVRQYPHRITVGDSGAPISVLMGYETEASRAASPPCTVAQKTARTEAPPLLPVALHEDAGEKARKVYDRLLDGATDSEGLQRELSMTASDVLIAVTELEMNGIISADRQHKYFIREE